MNASILPYIDSFVFLRYHRYFFSSEPSRNDKKKSPLLRSCMSFAFIWFPFSFLFPRILATTDFFSEPDAYLFSSLDDQDPLFNGDLIGGFSASGPKMLILVCGSVTYADGFGQRPGYFIVVKYSWVGQFLKWQVCHKVLKEPAVTFPSLLSCSLWDYFCCEYWDPDLVLRWLLICHKLWTDNVISRILTVWFEGLGKTARVSPKGPCSLRPPRTRIQNSIGISLT